MLTEDERLWPTLVIIALILILLTGVLGIIGEACPPPQNASTQYAKSGIVTSVDRKTDTVTFADRSGNEWSFTGAEDWMVGDHIAVVMDDCGTETIFDDRVVSVRYEG